MRLFAAVIALYPFVMPPDSTLAAQARAQRDSAARQPGDWTWGNDTQKWGIDPTWIHLGPVSFPTAVLGAVPIDATSNPVLGAREAQLNGMRADIVSHANQASNAPEDGRNAERARLGPAPSRRPVIPQP